MLLQADDLEPIARGAAILGSGGGGSTLYNLRMARYALQVHGPVQVMEVDELSEDDLVVPMAFMGAPMVGLEKLPSGREYRTLFEMIREKVGRPPTVLMAAEIGGANALTPIIAAATLKLPLLNADSIGRAFPELQISSMSVHGISASPAFFTDALGNRCLIEAQDAFTIERLGRQLTVAMGSRALTALYLMSGSEAKKSVIAGTLKQAHALGSMKSPGTILSAGKIVDVQYRISGGFLQGSCLIEEAEGTTVELLYKNEFLFAKRANEMIGQTPDILTLREQDTATVISTADLGYGLHVELITLPAPELWKTEEGLALVGPEQMKEIS